MKERTKVRWNLDAATHQHVREEVPIGKYIFSDEDRIAIVSEYVSGHIPAKQIAEKYHLSSRQVLFSWMDKFVNEKELEKLRSKAYDTMIDVAEKTFNIPIRKKSGTKQ